MRITFPLLKKIEGVSELTLKYSNLPEAYIKRCLEKVEWRTPRGYPQYMPKDIVRKAKYFGLNRPWTEAFWRDQDNHKKQVYVEPIKDWSFFKGDRVEILKGPDKGKQGTVVQVIQERNWVIIEGLNCKLKVMGKTATFPGTVIQEEQPLLVTKEVSLIDPSDFKPAKIEWRFTESGDRVRVSVRSGRIIPVPKQAEETYDYKTKKTYKESAKDSTEDQVTKITFNPSLSTFEMDIMKSEGITEDRIPRKTYWY